MTPHANIGDRLLQRGLTLVEILIAIAVGSILLTGVLQIFLAGKQAYRVLETNARLQENGRFAAEFLSDDVRMAGYLGCFRNDFSSIENNLKTPTAFNWNLGVAIEGYEWTGSGWSPPALPALIAGQVRNGTDVLVVRGLAEDGIHLVPPYPASGPGSAKFFVDQNADDIQDGDIVMVTDCNRASIFQVTNQQVIGTAVNLVHSNSGTFQPGNISSQLSNRYGPDAELARLRTYVYYIGTGVSGEPALIRSTLGPNGVMQAQELADGIENMQVLYGEDLSSDGLANRYVAADQIADPGKVVSVRISLLARSADKMASKPQSYFYDGATVTPTDLRVRRVFSSTIKLRNRGIL